MHHLLVRRSAVRRVFCATGRLATACIDAYAARAGMSLPLPTPVLALRLTALVEAVLGEWITRTVFARVCG
ncbi:hypothetical protein WL14_04580 [Burkholderia cepacia]|uniref:hypothetical protein n=1 Tax=Burkholderia cepacia TaxID=292 RepID=UPI00076C954B|nr:hypothetical protein [Burkholderia cepacia]KVZ28703.1 hypothetical protein WL14_04580 [Burkholderia cepacia]